jgi:hypothetical protein
MSDTTEPITTTTEPTVTEPSQLDPFAPEPEPIPEPPYAGYVDAIVYLFDRETYHTPSILTYTRRTNPKIPIVILGTPSHQQYVSRFNCELVDLSSLTVDLSYNYTHISPNEEAYEKGRFDRWLLLNAYMKTSPYEKILYSDYDNALFVDVNQLTALHESPSCLFVGNDYVSVPNILFMTKTVVNTIETYIRSFYSRPSEAVEAFVTTLQADMSGTLHYSDIWMLRDVFANLANTTPRFPINCELLPNIYKIDKATAPVVIDTNYWEISSKLQVSNGVAYLDGVLVGNLYFEGDSKRYPYGEN